MNQCLPYWGCIQLDILCISSKFNESMLKGKRHGGWLMTPSKMIKPSIIIKPIFLLRVFFFEGCR